jgi:thiol-disulfide isomerase/thioredoxin
MQSRRNLLIITLIALVVGIYISLQFDRFSADTVSAQTIFNTRFKDIHGNENQIGQWKGKTIVLNFWATWCPPCKQEMPELDQFYQKHQAQLVIIGISADDLETTQGFIHEHPVRYPILVGDMQSMGFAEALGNHQSVLPYTVVIDKAGKVRKTIFGKVHTADLETILH